MWVIRIFDRNLCPTTESVLGGYHTKKASEGRQLGLLVVYRVRNLWHVVIHLTKRLLIRRLNSIFRRSFTLSR